MQFYPQIEGQTLYLGARGSDPDLPKQSAGRPAASVSLCCEEKNKTN